MTSGRIYCQPQLVGSSEEKAFITQALVDITNNIRTRAETYKKLKIGIEENKNSVFFHVADVDSMYATLSEFNLFLRNDNHRPVIGITFGRNKRQSNPDALYYTVFKNEKWLLNGGLDYLLGEVKKPRNIEDVADEIWECIIQDKIPK